MEAESSCRSEGEPAKPVNVEDEDETKAGSISISSFSSSMWSLKIDEQRFAENRISSSHSPDRDDGSGVDDDDDDTDDDSSTVWDRISDADSWDSWLTYYPDAEMIRRLSNCSHIGWGSLLRDEHQDSFVREECRVCFDVVGLRRRSCCGLPVCRGCLRTYVHVNLASVGGVHFGCPNPACGCPLFEDEVRELLRYSGALRDRYERRLAEANATRHRKTCPRCSRVTDVEPSRLKRRSTARRGLMVDCSECHFRWCFPCQAPWHDGRTCKAYQKEGGAQLRNWARRRSGRRHERNAQRCPKCKVLLPPFSSVC